MSEAAPWLKDRRLAHLLTVWRELRPAAGRLPSRLSIDPLRLGADLLPHVGLVEAIDGGRRFRFRLVGSRIVAQSGHALVGHYIDELNPNPDYASYLGDLYRLTMRERQPVYSETAYRAPTGRTGLTRRLICPLAEDGVTVDMFVATQMFEADEGSGDAPTYAYAASFQPGVTLVVPD